MGDAIEVVSRAVRERLLSVGADALADPEWHVLRVVRLLQAADRGTLGRLLADAPIAELIDVADALDAIGAPNAGQRLRTATENLTEANDPGHGLTRGAVVDHAAALLREQLAAMRPELERRLLAFAIRQRALGLVATR